MIRLREIPGGRLAAIGGVWGLIAALGLAALRTVLGAINGDPLPWSLPGDLVFGAIFLLPYALALAALRWGSPALRAATWAAGAILSVLPVLTTFSGIGFAFVPAAPILLVAAVRAAWGTSLKRLALAAGLALLLIASNAGAFRALFLQADGMCWQLIREANGFERWEPTAYGDTGTINASGLGVIQSRCSSDVFSASEMALSAWLLAVAAAAWALARPTMHPPAPTSLSPEPPLTPTAP
jgi:hypothetical protein